MYTRARAAVIVFVTACLWLLASVLLGQAIIAQQRLSFVSAAPDQTQTPPTQTSQPPPPPARGQGQPPGQAQGQGRGQGGRGGWQGPMDEARARALYVSNDPADHSKPNYQTQIEERLRTEARFAEVAKGVLDYQKVSYRSSVGDMDIPAYLFQPTRPRGARRHAALVWVHGGVHGRQEENMWPFIKEAVDRGYVVIAPDYRGSTGYGERHYQAIDYGGYEIDDVMSAVGYLKTLAHVDPARLGIIGWSHGGYITLFSVFRDVTPFKAAAAIVPVTNLFFRLSYSGPGYQRSFATQARIGGLPFEKREEYVRRSPIFSVDKLNTPLLVHVATNDTDVTFFEDQQIVDALRARKPKLSETKIYIDPAPGPASGGHTFSRRVNRDTLRREDSPAQIDSWNLTWRFLARHLKPSGS
jgi:dipeptidyl aminopeptidase/acylaminoacyl peptidase